MRQVEGEEEAAVAIGWRCQEILDGEELAVAEKGDDALVHVGFGDAGELLAGLEGDADVGGTGEGGELFELAIAAFAGDGDAVEAAGPGAKGLFDGMEAIENFHIFSLPAENSRRRVDWHRKMV